MAPFRTLIISLILLHVPMLQAGAVLPMTGDAIGQVRVNSWRELRDMHIIKQQQDYSCGAAALATLLNAYYGQNLTEQKILDFVGINEAFSFADLVNAAQHFGFRPLAFVGDLNALRQLKMPAIVYLKVNRPGVLAGHFSVLRGMADNEVFLADPAWGNRRLTLARFEAMWRTRHDVEMPGKFIVFLPKKDNPAKKMMEFFRVNPSHTEYIHDFMDMQRMSIVPT